MEEKGQSHQPLGALEEMVQELQHFAHARPNEPLSYAWFNAAADCILGMKPEYGSRWFFRLQGHLSQHAVIHRCHAPEYLARLIQVKMNAKRRVA